jgi:hypothetical protein
MSIEIITSLSNKDGNRIRAFVEIVMEPWGFDQLMSLIIFLGVENCTHHSVGDDI